MLQSLRGKRWPGRASRRRQRAGPPCAGRAQAAPGSCLPARSKWLCLLLSSGRAPQRIPLCRHQLLSPAGGRRHRRHPRVPGRCSSVPRVPRGTGRGVTAGASTPGAPCPGGRVQLAHGAGPGHHLHRWGTTGACGILGGGIKGGTHPPEQPLLAFNSRRSRKGDKGGFPGAIPTPTLLPPQCRALAHSRSLPSQQRCSEPELELCHSVPIGAPQNGPVSSRTKPAAQPGRFWGVRGWAQTPATSPRVPHQKQ